ncbi:uncharacterized protein LOC119675920 [Teleopsis dalmanni]|uniref:uncharacterized protein LOC119675920 n=1 Tax=Teleopsis dalmanni TaxID=139649 RepID=UPI0018CDD2B2|nr:uncharacterized protein LOC119675920 [Teleopsis dalmanni]
MALDILIVGLILLSLGINILALGAFWITPSLRTLSNRFTINLLCINTLGSIILLHNLLISNNMELKVTLNQNYFADLNFGIYQQYEAMIHQDNVMLNNSLPFNEYNKQIKNIDKLLKLNETISERYFKNWMNENLDIINWNDVPVYIQHWSLDVCAALGSLAFLLIVSNIWCAITDPLRYKGRITGDRVSKCIAFTWILSAIIAVVSYFTATPFKYNLFRDYIYTNFNLELFTFNIDLSKIYTVTYFFSISLLPFIFISYMCWKVSYEARNNDLRIRKTSATLPVRRGSNSNIAKYQHKVGPPHIHSSFINKNFILNCTLKHKINKKEVVSKRYVNIRRISTRKLRGSIRCKQNVNVKSNKHHDNQNKYSLIRISNASLYKIKKKSQITKLRSPSNIQKLKRLIPCLYEKRLPVAIHLQNMQLKSQFTNCTYFPNLKQVKPLNKSEKLLITKGFVFSPSSNHRFRNNYLPLKCCKASRSSIISILANTDLELSEVSFLFVPKYVEKGELICDTVLVLEILELELTELAIFLYANS